MAITGSGWPGGYLTADMILQGIGDSPGSQIDLISFGYLVGVGDGVVGSGNDVVLPTDFWGQDINKTANSITLAGGLSSLSFTKASQAYTLSINSNGVGKLDNLDSWVSAATTYFTNSTTSIQLLFSDNSGLGSPDRTFQLQGVGSGNSVLDTVDITQTGNPASVTITSPSFSRHTATGTQFTITKTSNTNWDSVTVGNNLLTLTLISNPTTNTRVYGIEWASGPSYSLSAITTTVVVVVSDTSDATSTLTEPKACNVPGFDNLALGGVSSVDKDGETQTFTVNGEVGATFSIAIVSGYQYSYSIDGVANATTGTVGDVISMTWQSNQTGVQRAMTINVTDTTSGNSASGRTFTQSPQILANFEVKEGSTVLSSPSSHTYAWNGGAKSFTITCEPNGSNSSEIKAIHYSADFEHCFSTSSPGTFTGSGTNIFITPTAGNNWTVQYYIKPVANNTSILNDIGPANTSLNSVADISSSHNFSNTQTKQPVQYSWYFAGSNQSGISSANPIGPNTSNTQEFRVWSNTNAAGQSFRISGMGSLKWHTNPGQLNYNGVNPYPSSTTYWTPTWSGSGGNYYSTFFAQRTGTSYSCTTPSYNNFYLYSSLSNAPGPIKFQSTPTSTNESPMGSILYVCP